MSIAQFPTPIFNTPEIPFFHLPLKKDNQGRLMALETISFPGTLFTCLAQIAENVVQVETTEYPSSPLYVDSRFLIPGTMQERKKILPPSTTILQRLESCKGSRYLWGGNWNQGIPQMLDFYPMLDQEDDDAFCRGVDCSGLLHQATDGITPRNTSQLVDFGQELKIQHLPPDQIQQHLKPLDLMVWRGHVLIALSPDTFIESRIKQGVVITDFQTRYREAVANLQGQPFYFRRWYSN